VLQCVAVCYMVLPCVAVCCSVLATMKIRNRSMGCSVSQFVVHHENTKLLSGLLCVAVCCNVLAT